MSEPGSATNVSSAEADPAARWYALWTRSRHEKSVRDQLAEQEVEVFLPTITRWSRWRDRKKQVEWPLFPGYCFARFDSAHRLPILKCHGVVTIVGMHGEPSAIPDQEIDGVRQLVESELSFDPCPLIKEGTMVKVAHGPLKGIVGRLVRKGPHARLVIAVDLIGRGASVQVDAVDVRRL